MDLTFITNKLKSLILFIVATFRRALCCFRRRKRVSFSENDQLTHVGVVANQTVNEFENWNDWNNDSINNRKPQTVQEHIEYYRKKQAQITGEKVDDVEEIEENFFEDMTPNITKQMKVLIGSTNNDVSNTHNLSLTPENVVYFVRLLFSVFKFCFN